MQDFSPYKSCKYFYTKCAATLSEISNKNADVINSKFDRINLINKSMIIRLIILSISFLFLAISLTNIIPILAEKLGDFL